MSNLGFKMKCVNCGTTPIQMAMAGLGGMLIRELVNGHLVLKCHPECYRIIVIKTPFVKGEQQ